MASVLKSMTFACLPDPRDVLTLRRGRLIARLEEQKQLFQSPDFVRTTTRWKGKGDDRHAVERRQKVRPWWRAAPDGALIFSVYYGTKPIEFEKGKAAVALGSKDKLPAVIDALINAVKAGELDEHMARMSSAGSVSVK